MRPFYRGRFTWAVRDQGGPNCDVFSAEETQATNETLLPSVFKRNILHADGFNAVHASGGKPPKG